jgi:hypothetical protein
MRNIVMDMQIKITLLASLLLSFPLAALAVEEAEIIEIFNKYNKAMRTADTEALKGVLVKLQARGIEECLASDLCGKHLAENLKNDALISYRVTNFVEFDEKGKVVKQRDKAMRIEAVSGPAVQVYYEGEETRGDKGSGYITFVIEDGVWKISTVSWKKSAVRERYS